MVSGKREIQSNMHSNFELLLCMPITTRLQLQTTRKFHQNEKIKNLTQLYQRVKETTRSLKFVRSYLTVTVYTTH